MIQTKYIYTHSYIKKGKKEKKKEEGEEYNNNHDNIYFNPMN